MSRIRIMTERCKGCETCNGACPVGILKMSESLNAQGYHYSMVDDPSRCLGCRLCAISCPDLAIEVFAEGAHYRFFAYESESR